MRCQEDMEENINSQTCTQPGKEVQTGKDSGNYASTKEKQQRQVYGFLTDLHII